MSNTYNFTIKKGATHVSTLRWEDPADIRYAPISAITKTAPVVITAVGHGLPDRWRVAVQSVKGMTELNAKASPPALTDYRVGVVVDVDNIKFVEINALDFTAYASGGVLVYNAPIDLTGFTARMQMRPEIDSPDTELIDTLTSTDVRLPEHGILIDPVNFTIEIRLGEVETADYTFETAVYDLEMVSPDGVVTRLVEGKITTDPEVTRT